MLKGLVTLSREENGGNNVQSSGTYSTSAEKTKDAVSKAKSLRQTLGKIFNKNSFEASCASNVENVGVKNKRPLPDEDDFEPTPLRYRGKAKYSQSQRTKRKIKEIRIRVVGLDSPRSTISVGDERDKLIKTIWVREIGSDRDVVEKIMSAFGWSDCDIEYMYASGRHLIFKLVDWLIKCVEMCIIILHKEMSFSVVSLIDQLF